MVTFVEISWKFEGRMNWRRFVPSWSGCLRAVAITWRRGVVTTAGTGFGLMMCWILFLLDGAGVGGKGVGAGVGAPRWFTTTGRMKS